MGQPINFDRCKTVVWNLDDDRPATLHELQTLDVNGQFIVNYFSTSENGLVWIDLDSLVDNFEIRKL